MLVLRKSHHNHALKPTLHTATLALGDTDTVTPVPTSPVTCRLTLRVLVVASEKKMRRRLGSLSELAPYISILPRRNVSLHSTEILVVLLTVTFVIRTQRPISGI